jgi:pentatricopeptide repeat protein
MEKAVECLSKAQEAGLKPDIITYSAVIDTCVKSDDVEKAVEWLSKAREARLEPNIIIYNAVIDACAKSGDTEKVVARYQTYDAITNACVNSVFMRKAVVYVLTASNCAAQRQSLCRGLLSSKHPSANFST